MVAKLMKLWILTGWTMEEVLEEEELEKYPQYLKIQNRLFLLQRKSGLMKRWPQENNEIV
jgi:hypothetical protein